VSSAEEEPTPLRWTVASRVPCLVICWRGVMVEVRLYCIASVLRMVSSRVLGGWVPQVV
jgi:hypothetical protein